jgi:hypothetical protein
VSERAKPQGTNQSNAKQSGRTVPQTKSEGDGTGVGVALGAGLGMTVGLLVAGGPGIALGLTMGAGLGVLVGAVWPVLGARWVRANRLSRDLAGVRSPPAGSPLPSRDQD